MAPIGAPAGAPTVAFKGGCQIKEELQSFGSFVCYENIFKEQARMGGSQQNALMIEWYHGTGLPDNVPIS
jgi:apolipoprotein N-acyltransferase